MLTPKFTKLVFGFLDDFCVFSHHFLDGIMCFLFYNVLGRFESHFGSFLAACGLHLEHFERSWRRCGRVIGSLVDTLGLPGRHLTSNWGHEGVAGGSTWGRLGVKFTAPSVRPSSTVPFQHVQGILSDSFCLFLITFVFTFNSCSTSPTCAFWRRRDAEHVVEN